MDSKNGRRTKKGNKATPVIILKILKEKTDEEHVLQNADIRKILDEEYGIVVDRKKISDDIQLLREVCNIDIVHNEGGPKAKGYWLRDRVFEDYELRLLIDSVLSNKYLSEEDSYDLILKLEDLYGGMFDPHFESIIVLDRRRKTVDRGLYEKIRTIHKAIESSAGIIMMYYTHRVTWNSPSYRKILPPCCMILKDNRYYLVIDHELKDEDKSTFEFIPLDEIKSIKLTEPMPEFNNEPRKKQKEALRRMIETNLAESIETHAYYFYTTGDMLAEIDTHFGVDPKNVRLNQRKNMKLEDLKIRRPESIIIGQNITAPVIYEVKVETSEKSFMRFAKKNMNYIKIIKPAEMIDLITSDLKHALNMY